MASASSSSARHLFSDSKKRLSDRVAVNVNNLGSVARQIVRASKSNEILGNSIRNFTQVDIVSDYSYENLNKMKFILQHVDQQQESIKDSVNQLDFLKEQVSAMER